MNFKLKCYISVLKNLFMNKMKEVLHELKKVFVNDVEKTELSEAVLETEVITEQVELAETTEETTEVELAEAPMDESKEDAPVVEEKVEYVTKLELQDFQRTIMELLEKVLKPMESKQDVPKELSADEKTELSEVPEEISHSPEVEVEKKADLYRPKVMQNESIQSRVYSKLFN